MLVRISALDLCWLLGLVGGKDYLDRYAAQVHMHERLI